MSSTGGAKGRPCALSRVRAHVEEYPSGPSGHAGRHVPGPPAAPACLAWPFGPCANQGLEGQTLGGGPLDVPLGLCRGYRATATG